jgi:hypothetical protein
MAANRVPDLELKAEMTAIAAAQWMYQWLKDQTPGTFSGKVFVPPACLDFFKQSMAQFESIGGCG